MWPQHQYRDDTFLPDFRTVTKVGDLSTIISVLYLNSRNKDYLKVVDNLIKENLIKQKVKGSNNDEFPK